ncbi:MAG: TonB-dependent receptor domain-containing protein, partial [bacterium]
MKTFKQNLSIVLSFFTSFSTLICCALPSLLVTLGLGAVVASTIPAVPLFTFELYAQHNATIKGYVRDAEKDKPLAGANVLILGTTQGAATDKRGFYEIKDVPTGEYKLEARMIGYKKQIRGVTVKQGETLQLNFGLVPTLIELNEVTIEANKITNPLPVMKIKSRQIRRLAPASTADILKEVPGVSTSRSGSWGTKPYLQGMTDSRILVFIDGVKTNQACPMGMDACTATIEPDMIENIEVQKGPGSAQYGSGNIGGVINISTINSKYSTSQNFETDVNFVSKYESVSNSRTGRLSLGGGNERFDFIASVGGGLHDDYKTRKGAIENSGFESRNIQLKTRYRPGHNQQLLFSTQIYRAQDIGWPAANTIIPDEKRDTYALGYTVSNIAQALQMVKANFSYSPMYHNMINYLPGNVQFNGDSKTNTYNADVTGYWAIGKNNTLTTGIFYSLWKMHAKSSVINNGVSSPFIDILPNSSLSEIGFFIEDEYKISNRLKVQTGIRANYISSNAKTDTASTIFQDNLQFKEFVLSGSAGLLYNITENIALTTSVSKGFKAATPVERYISAPMMDGYYRIGNPGLRSETNISKRIGLKGMQNRFNWNIEVYHNSLSNLISAEVDSSTASPYQGIKRVKRCVGINKANIVGANASVGLAITQSLFLNTNVSYDWGHDTTSDEPLPGMAPLRSTTRLTFDNSDNGYWFELAAMVAASQNRYAKRYGEQRTPGYVVFDL